MQTEVCNLFSTHINNVCPRFYFGPRDLLTLQKCHFQTINSHLAIEVIQGTWIPIYDSHLCCFFEQKGHCSTDLCSASSISYSEGYGKDGLGVRTRHACSLAARVCVCVTFIIDWRENLLPTLLNDRLERLEACVKVEVRIKPHLHIKT